MKFLKGLSGPGHRELVESDHRIVDDRPKRFLNIPLHEGQSLEEFLAANKKRMADAEASAPAVPEPIAMPAPEEASCDELSGSAPTLEAATPKSMAFATSPEGMAAAKVNSAERAGASQHHSAVQAAARAEGSMKRNAARPSTPSAGRSL